MPSLPTSQRQITNCRSEVDTTSIPPGRGQCDGCDEFTDCSGTRRVHIVGCTCAPRVLTLCVLYRSPTSMALAPAAYAPRWTGWARDTAPPGMKCSWSFQADTPNAPKCRRESCESPCPLG